MSVRLGKLTEIPDGSARGYVADLGKTSCKVIVYRDGDNARGFEDACPHMGVPLPWAADAYLTPDGRYLRCANHGALFDLHGVCVFGPCKGEQLTPLPIEVKRGDVWLLVGGKAAASRQQSKPGRKT
ncbi:MAG: Rieske 2Fe-2S domain-containing protein [Alphaproteobacteria bacterium]